jgi:hypothetical protein
MVSEKLNLWFCDTFVNQPWQFIFMVLPLVGAFLYGRGKQKTGWILIIIWVVIQMSFTALTNFVFTCNLD